MVARFAVLDFFKVVARSHSLDFSDVSASLLLFGCIGYVGFFPHQA